MSDVIRMGTHELHRVASKEKDGFDAYRSKDLVYYVAKHGGVGSDWKAILTVSVPLNLTFEANDTSALRALHKASEKMGDTYEVLREFYGDR